MGIFGWSYPPGVSRVPGDEPDPPCQLCGNDAYDCKCAPCATCETPGCIEHMTNANLLTRFEFVAYLYDGLKTEIERRNAALPPKICGKCKAEIKDDIRREDLLWCSTCKTSEDEWF